MRERMGMGRAIIVRKVWGVALGFLLLTGLLPGTGCHSRSAVYTVPGYSLCGVDAVSASCSAPPLVSGDTNDLPSS